MQSSKLSALAAGLALATGSLAHVAIASADDGGATRKLTFKSAIDLAVGQNPEVAIAADAVDTAAEQTEGVKAKRLPTLHVDASANLYAESYQLTFPGLGSFALYKQETTSTNVSISEPLSGLIFLSEVVGAAEHRTNAARAELDKTKLDIAYHTASDYILVLKGRATAEVAHQEVAQIAGDLAHAEQLRAAGALTDIDVLRLKSAKAAADQLAVKSDSTVQIALAALVIRLGLHDGASIDVVDDLPTPPPAPAMTIEQAQARAMSVRPELRAAMEKIAAAENARVQAREQYLPDIRAVGVYLHTTGVQPFQPANAEFVGLTLSWNVWDWGATHHAVVVAEHDKSRELLAAGALGDDVRVGVRHRWLDAKANYDTLASAETQVQTAEEAYRLQKARFDAGAATTTDVLDAETDVARGRLQFAVARFDYYTTLVALARAIGDFPSSTAESK